MAHVVLLNAVDAPFTASCLLPDNGLASLAACLQDAGHDVEIWDPGTVSTVRDHVTDDVRTRIRAALQDIREGRLDEERFAAFHALEADIEGGLAGVYARLRDALDARAARGGLDLLGLKLWFGGGLRPALALAHDLARRHPHLRIFGGGPLASLAPEWTLSVGAGLAGVCVGDGEEAIVALADLCDGRGAPESAPNLVLRDGAGVRVTRRRAVDLDTIPRPVYDPSVYPAMAGDEKIPIACIDESRGCPMRCPFCAHHELTGDRWRLLAAERVVADMLRLGRAGMRAFRLSGSYTPARHYRAIADGLTARGADVSWSGFAHVNGVRGEELPALRRAGLRALFFGVESGAAALLSGPLGKRTKPEGIERVLRASLDAGIFTCGSVIVPAPGETAETEAETLRLLTGVFGGRDDGAVPVQFALPEPGSAWWAEPERYGFAFERPALLASLATRRVRHVLPMEVFEPLPFTLDGTSAGAQTLRTARFTRALREAGVLTNIGDDTALIAFAAGLTPRAFQTLDHEIFQQADAERAEDLVRRIARA